MIELALYQNIVEHAVEGIMITGADRRIGWVNRSFTRITGYKAAEAIGQNPSFMKSGFHDKAFFAAMWVALARSDWWKGEIWNRRKSGDLFVVSATIRVIRGSHGEVIHYVSIFTDITDRMVIERQLQKDLQLAKQIQHRVISPPLVGSGIRMDSYYVHSEALGGDMFAWYQIEPGKYGIFLMDVMGHGVAASLIGMSIRSLLQSAVTRVSDPVEVMMELNVHMRGLYYRENNQDVPLYFFTGIYLIVDTMRRELCYVNAGHPPAILQSLNGHIRLLDQGSVPIGVLDMPHMEAHCFPYEASSRLLLYTDGLLGGAGLSLQDGIDNLCEWMEQWHHVPDDQIISRIVEACHVDDQQADDICVLYAFLA